MRTIKKIHRAVSDPIGDLTTFRALPTASIEYIDPFLFLNHHGPQVYPPGNQGLPFGPHPHRGMETVTFILAGDIAHRDTGGHESVIEAGGVQWMTAGRGLIHAEVSSGKFMREGGRLEILQLWLNLPARRKMCEPFYKGLQREEIPRVESGEGRVSVDLVSGGDYGREAAFHSETGIALQTIRFAAGGKIDLNADAARNVFFYVISGELKVDGTSVSAHHLAEFNNDGERITIAANEESVLLYGHAAPLGEPVVAQGPFVMNTEREILEAYQDYRRGAFGVWQG